jgi:hypothetical protein
MWSSQWRLAQPNRPAAVLLAANDNRLSPLSRTKLGPISRVALIAVQIVLFIGFVFARLFSV